MLDQRYGEVYVKKEEISLKNTKAEILEALNEALEREKYK